MPKVIQRKQLAPPGFDDVDYGPEAASQTFPRGALLIRSGGKLAVAAETSQNVNGSQVLVGTANHAANKVADADVRFARLRYGVQYEMQVCNGSDTLVGANQATIGTAYGLRRISQTVGDETVYTYAVDVSDTSAPYVRVVGTALEPGETANTAGTSVRVVFMDGVLEV